MFREADPVTDGMPTDLDQEEGLSNSEIDALFFHP